MKPLKSAKGNGMVNAPKQRSSKTPKMAAPIKVSDPVEVQPITCGKLQQMDSLKQKQSKTKLSSKTKNAAESSSSALKENEFGAKRNSATENSSPGLNAGKCIEQIEQELNHLKKLTRFAKEKEESPADDENNSNSSTYIAQLLSALRPLIKEYPEYPELMLQLSLIKQNLKKLKHSMKSGCTLDQAIQTVECGSSKKTVAAEYEKKIAEMKINVYEMKERMSELEAIYKVDNEKINGLENELKETRDKFMESQREYQKLFVWLRMC